MHIMIVLNDATLWGDQLGALNDHHFMTASVLGGYFIYDTLMVLGDMEAEEQSAGAAQIIIHHLLVLSTLPVGLIYNTWAFVGSGVLIFWTEITAPSLNLVWILRTAGWETHWVYIVNGLMFSFGFVIIRVFVLGYYVYTSTIIVRDNWDNPEHNCNEISACQFGLFLNWGLWLWGLLIVPDVAKKVMRAINKFLSAQEEETKEDGA